MMTYEELFEPCALKPRGVAHVTGPTGEGKSLFSVGLMEIGLDTRRIAVLDMEQSLTGAAKTLESLADEIGFGAYIDVIKEWQRQGGGIAMSPAGLLKTVIDFVEGIEEGQFDVVVLDNIQPLEDALEAEITMNPTKYGLSSGQAETPLKWGPIKAIYRTLLGTITAKCPLCFTTSHLTQVWMQGAPVPGLYKPKGKDVLDQQTWLRIWLVGSSTYSKWPDGLVLKTRLVRPVKTDRGIEWEPAIPRKLVPASWEHIYEYMLDPPRPSDIPPEEKPTISEWAKIRGAMTESQSNYVRALADGKVRTRYPDTAAEFIEAVSKAGMALNDALERLGKELSEIDPYEDFQSLSQE